jgi:predicted nucleotidyltransferase
MMSDENIQQIVEVIATRLSPRRVILFGSYARGEAGPDSDLIFLWNWILHCLRAVVAA